MSQIRHDPVAPTHVETRSAGDVIDRHRHDEHQLIYVSTGVLAIQTEGGAWIASPGRAVWIPAGLWHEHRFFGHSSFHTVGFRLDDAPALGTAPTVVGVNGLLRELLIACTEPGLSAAESRRIRAVLHDRLTRAKARPLVLPTAKDARLADACRLVLMDLSRPRALRWLASTVGTSERTLTRLFRIEFGMTYPQWRTNARIVDAMIRLAEGASVTATANRCGWATTSAFIDTFGQAMGQTPGAYRAAARPEPIRQ
ncbi:MAG TPA: helix-turn-helix transcriptional regulator [Pseudonocardiaceae bacterium]|jgi:AraC-like DNA-binding protein|nr:helix-turn-helix transcriptional regulator [Pseudonocardiaceae bacterium]